MTQPVQGTFRVTTGTGTEDFRDEAGAIAAAEAAARDAVARRAGQAGAETFEVSVARDVRTAPLEGKRSFIDATITATAVGRPRVASD